MNTTKAFKRKSKQSKADKSQFGSMQQSQGNISKRHKRKISYDPNGEIPKIEPQKILINLKSNQDEIILENAAEG